MGTRFDRRHFVGAGLAGGAALWLGHTALAQAAPAATRLGERLVLITGAGVNTLAIETADGVALVDGGHAAHAADTAALAGGPDRIGLLFNTNWRPEHTGLNALLGPRGARIVAHENTRLWLANDFTVPWEGARHTPMPAAALPNETFYTTHAIDFGGVHIDCGYLKQAHTDGDIYVHLPDDDVLVASDLLAVGAFPVVDYVTGGWIGGMERATAALLELTGPNTRVVPAAGPVQTRAALEAQLELVTAVREAVRDAYRDGLSAEEFIALAPARRFAAERGDPTQFLTLVHKGAWGHARELGAGII